MRFVLLMEVRYWKIRRLRASGTEDPYLAVDVEIASDLRMNQEYSMQIALETEGKTVYYYTRVVSRSQVHAADYASFVKYFYEASLDKDAADELATYLEPETTGAETNYSGININSSLERDKLGNSGTAVVPGRNSCDQRDQ